MTNPETTPPPRKKHGCFFYGCITSLVLLLVAIAGIFFAVRFVMHKVNDMVLQYTQASPMALEKTDMAPDDVKKLQARIDAFSKAMNAHANPQPLVLTGPEINALIASNPNMRQFKDDIFISLDGDQIKAQVSLPLEVFADQVGLNSWPANMVDVKGRYLNGSATVKASIADGKLSVFVQSLETQGKPVPAQALAGISQQNLADGFNKSANPSPFQQFESIQIKGGTLIVTPKSN